MYLFQSQWVEAELVAHEEQDPIVVGACRYESRAVDYADVNEQKFDVLSSKIRLCESVWRLLVQSGVVAFYFPDLYQPVPCTGQYYLRVEMDDACDGPDVSLLDRKQVARQNVVNGDVVQEVFVLSSQINEVALLTVMHIVQCRIRKRPRALRLKFRVFVVVN